MADSTEPDLTVQLLGPTQVCIGGDALPPVRSQKVKWLLVLLVLQRGREVPRTWLAQQLWPDADTDRALNSLSQCLTSLTRALGPAATHICRPDKHTLQLDLSGVQVDLFDFEARIRRGDTASLQRAVDLYSGPLLEGCREFWAVPERAVRHKQYQEALCRLAAQARACGDFPTAERCLRLALIADPWNEAVRRDLMQTLAHAGDVQAALSVYQDWLGFLQHEQPGLLPQELTRTLYERLRSATRSIPMPSPTAASPSSLPSLHRPRGFLPVPLTDLIGNEEALAQVRACLYRDRLVTLLGSGGMGKTRLAVAAAHGVAEEFVDGVWFVDLSSLSDAGRIARAIASVLELVEVPGRAWLESLIHYARQRHLLLVVDNCEHVVTGCRTLLGALLGACPHLSILATSREALRLTGEVRCQVPALEIPPDRDKADEADKNIVGLLLEYSSIRLFVERARSVSPEFALTPANGSVVARICRDLEGVPLALELAAVWVRALSVDEIALRLGDRFGLLAGGDPSRPRRYQTLRAALDWSYELLSGPERRLLGRLSVFSGGWTLEAAEHVCALQGREGREEGSESWRVLGLLRELVDKSLVVYEVREAEGRYRVLETIREYASEKLAESGEESAVRMRHLDFFLAFAERAEPELHSPSQLRWLQRLDAEHANFRAALATSLQHSELAEQGMRLAGALGWFWYRRAHLREGMERLQTFLGMPEAQGVTAVRGRLLLCAGMFAYYLGDRPHAIDLLQECTRIYRELNDPAGVAGSLVYQGITIWLLKGPVEAEGLLTESVALWRTIGDDWGLGMALWGLGAALLWRQGGIDEAQTALEESIDLFGRIGDFWGIGGPLRVLGGVMENRGDLRRARSLLEQAVDAARIAEDAFRLAYFNKELAHLCSELEDYETAMQCDRESIRLHEQLGLWCQRDSEEIAESYIRVGRYYRRKGDLAQSLHHFGKGLEAVRATGATANAEIREMSIDLNPWIAEAEQALRDVKGEMGYE